VSSCVVCHLYVRVHFCPSCAVSDTRWSLLQCGKFIRANHHAMHLSVLTPPRRVDQNTVQFQGLHQLGYTYQTKATHTRPRQHIPDQGNTHRPSGNRRGVLHSLPTLRAIPVSCFGTAHSLRKFSMSCLWLWGDYVVKLRGQSSVGIGVDSPPRSCHKTFRWFRYRSRPPSKTACADCRSVWSEIEGRHSIGGSDHRPVESLRSRQITGAVLEFNLEVVRLSSPRVGELVGYAWILFGFWAH